MSTALKPGDRVYFVSQSGLKLRGVVADALGLKTRGEELLVPIQRPRNVRRETCPADRGDHHPSELKTRWLKRSEVRKLPQ